MVTDASGGNLTSYNDAGLSTIAGLLKASAPASEGANSGLDVEIQTSAGKPVPNAISVIMTTSAFLIFFARSVASKRVRTDVPGVLGGSASASAEIFSRNPTTSARVVAGRRSSAAGAGRYP